MPYRTSTRFEANDRAKDDGEIPHDKQPPGVTWTNTSTRAARGGNDGRKTFRIAGRCWRPRADPPRQGGLAVRKTTAAATHTRSSGRLMGSRRGMAGEPDWRLAAADRHTSGVTTTSSRPRDDGGVKRFGFRGWNVDDLGDATGLRGQSSDPNRPGLCRLMDDHVRSSA